MNPHARLLVSPSVGQLVGLSVIKISKLAESYTAMVLSEHLFAVESYL